jgi:paraquat-inducible protein B
VSQKIKTTSIGLFIVAGMALGVAGVLLFSSVKFFTPTRDIIAYFDESLNGLNEGAPVKYRGVVIGSVKRVMVRFNQATNDYSMPVVLEIDEKLLRSRVGDSSYMFSETVLNERIKLGLRASLQTESLVTGLLYVDVRLNPDAPQAVFHQLEKLYPELPTEPTQIQELFKNLASLNLKRIESNLNSVLVKLETMVGALQMAEINAGITNVLNSVNKLVSSPALTNGLAAVGPTLDEYRLLGQKLNSRIDPLADSLTNSLAEADLALKQFRGAAENLRTLLDPDSAVRYDLEQALQQLAGAGQSFSALLDFLRRHPNALITGRENQGKKHE